MSPSQQRQKRFTCTVRVSMHCISVSLCFFAKTLQVTEWIPGFYPGEKMKTMIRNKHQNCKSTITLPAVQNHMLTVGWRFFMFTALSARAEVVFDLYCKF